MFKFSTADPLLTTRLWAEALTTGWRPYMFHLWHGGELPNPVIPRSYNEKMLWRKIFDHDPFLTKISDKLLSRRVARERCPEILLPEILWEGDDIRDLPFDSVDFPIIVKMNNACGRNFVMRAQDPTLVAEAISKFARWQRKPRYGRSRGEWAYRNIVPRVYAERLLVEDSGLPPDEYKLYMSDGQLAQMIVVHDRCGAKALVDYNGNAERIDFDHLGWSQDYDPPDLDMIDEILAVGKALSASLDYVRIDLYVHRRKIYFGEYTLYPSSGFGNGRLLNPMRGENWDIRKSVSFNSSNPLRQRYLAYLNLCYQTEVEVD